MKVFFKIPLFLFCLFTYCTNSQNPLSNNIDTIPEIPITNSIIDENFEDDDDIDTLALKLKLNPQGSYKQLKSRIIAKRESIKSEYQTTIESLKPVVIEKTQEYLTEVLVNEIFPFWYGTPWDFNGYTAIPNEGLVACGYFVSTTLRDAGFNLNRYKLAQQSGKNEALSLQGDSIFWYTPLDYYDLEDSLLSNHKDGLYFVGLDYHVGFLLIRNRELLFIHSNYIGAEGVIIEYAEFSDAFYSSYNYVIAEISTNERLIEKWILNEEIKIVRQ